jgi:hypothetical protein
MGYIYIYRIVRGRINELGEICISSAFYLCQLFSFLLISLSLSRESRDRSDNQGWLFTMEIAVEAIVLSSYYLCNDQGWLKSICPYNGPCTCRRFRSWKSIAVFGKVIGTKLTMPINYGLLRVEYIYMYTYIHGRSIQHLMR